MGGAGTVGEQPIMASTANIPAVKHADFQNERVLVLFVWFMGVEFPDWMKSGIERAQTFINLIASVGAISMTRSFKRDGSSTGIGCGSEIRITCPVS